MCLKLTIKTPERMYYERITRTVLAFLRISGNISTPQSKLRII